MKNKIDYMKLTRNVLMATMFLSFGISFYGIFFGKSLAVFWGIFLMQAVSVSVLYLAFRKFGISKQVLIPLIFLNVIIFTGNARNLPLPVAIGRTMAAVRVIMAVLMGLYTLKMASMLLDSDGCEIDKGLEENEDNKPKQ